jgi:hypothetical protein
MDHNRTPHHDRMNSNRVPGDDRMHHNRLPHHDRIPGALRDLAPGLEAAGYDAWTLNPTVDAASRVVVRRRGDWLLFEMPSAEHEPRPSWELLDTAGAGPGPGKAVLAPDGRTFHVRADVPAGLNGTLGDRCREAMASVRLIDALLRGHLKAEAGSPSAPLTADPEESPRPLRELCAEAGWSVRERATGELVVDLKTARGSYAAEAVTEPEGTTRIFVRLARFESLSETSREALGRFLLTAGRVLRLVRPVIRDEEAGLTVGFEFQTCLSVTAEDVDEALNALATAAQEFGREAKSLGDETLARRYMSLIRRTKDLFQ